MLNMNDNYTYPINEPIQYNSYQPDNGNHQPPMMNIPQMNNPYYQMSNPQFNNSTPNQYNPYHHEPIPSDVNRSMNKLVKSAHKDRGIIVKDNGATTPYGNNNFNEEHQQRKLQLLNNIQQQLSLTKSNKLLELEKRKKEDEKYLNDMNNFYPFGRYLNINV
jgi:hypothetical protein